MPGFLAMSRHLSSGGGQNRSEIVLRVGKARLGGCNIKTKVGSKNRHHSHPITKTWFSA